LAQIGLPDVVTSAKNSQHQADARMCGGDETVAVSVPNSCSPSSPSKKANGGEAGAQFGQVVAVAVHEPVRRASELRLVSRPGGRLSDRRQLIAGLASKENSAKLAGCR
jgi:hypothetical protein